MPRKTSIDRAINTNASVYLPQLQDLFLNRSEKLADDAVYIHINSILNNLRSTLDYTTNDIVDAAKPTCSPPIYFPYAHPTTKNGKPRDQAATLNHFEQKKGVREIKRRLPKVYQVLKGIQGCGWLHELIETVNKVKHDDHVSLGPPEIVIGGLIAVPGKNIVFHNVKVNEHEIRGPVLVSNDQPIPEEIKDFSYIRESIGDANFKGKWIDRLEDWNKKVGQLIEDIYAGMP